MATDPRTSRRDTVDRIEAAQLLDEELAHYAPQPHARLLRLVDEIDAYPIVAPSGIEYQVEINAYWSGQPGGAIHVLAGIDDGSFRGASRPLRPGSSSSRTAEWSLKVGPVRSGRPGLRGSSGETAPE